MVKNSMDTLELLCKAVAEEVQASSGLRQLSGWRTFTALAGT